MANSPSKKSPKGITTKGITNVLGDEPSSYLQQHKANPIGWQVWGEQAFKLAEQTNRPIMLSSGYAACHWCHVMASESFEDPKIAEEVNKNFIPIKLDREEHPDVDMVYQTVLQAMGEQGGWPLTMFLTPKGEPFWGGTYFPSQSKFGRPSFRMVLEAIANLWQSEMGGGSSEGKGQGGTQGTAPPKGTVQDPATPKDTVQGKGQGTAPKVDTPPVDTQAEGKIARNAAALKLALAPLANPKAGGSLPSQAELEGLLARLAFDSQNGGIGNAPKFPQVPLLDALWQVERFRGFVVLTVEKMCGGGIFDHLGGGFARYAVDNRWLVPHFEKMLYDNGQLLGLLARVYNATKSQLVLGCLEGTVQWLEREMVVKGCYAAALDADSLDNSGSHTEGAFYVWSFGELTKLLGEDAAKFCQQWGASKQGNFEGNNILHSTAPMLPRHRALLMEARSKRPPPERDHKILADSNALAIRGLAEAGMSLPNHKHLFGLATERFEALWRLLHRSHLHHCYMGGKDMGDMGGKKGSKGEARHRATLDDYAQVMLAALTLAKGAMAKGAMAKGISTNKAASPKTSKHYIAIARQLFEELKGEYATATGYVYSASKLLPVKIKPLIDGPTPAGNSALIEALMELYHLTQEPKYKGEAKTLAKALAEDARRYFPSSAAYFKAAIGVSDG